MCKSYFYIYVRLAHSIAASVVASVLVASFCSVAASVLLLLYIAVLPESDITSGSYFTELASNFVIQNRQASVTLGCLICIGKADTT